MESQILLVLLGLSLLVNVWCVLRLVKAWRHQRQVEQAEELDLSQVDVTLHGNDGMHLLFRPNMAIARTLRTGDVVRLSELAASGLKQLSLSHAGKQYLLDPEMENCLLRITMVSPLLKDSLLIEGKLEIL